MSNNKQVVLHRPKFRNFCLFVFLLNFTHFNEIQFLIGKKLLLLKVLSLVVISFELFRFSSTNPSSFFSRRVTTFFLILTNFLCTQNRDENRKERKGN